MSKEEWRDIKFTDTDYISYDYTGLYQISNMGRVKSIKDGEEHIMKVVKRKDGYCNIRLCKDNIYKSFSIHRLVAHMFVLNPDNKPTVDHINAIRDDNRACNLRWFTRKEQMSDNEISRGRIIKTAKENVKLAQNAIKKRCMCITTGEIFDSVRDAAVKYNIKECGISRCCRGEGKSYKGKKWKYIEEE